MEIVETKRTKIRAFTLHDFEDLFEMMSNEDVMKFTGFRKIQSSDRVKQLLETWIIEGTSPLGVWAVEEKSSGDFIGWFMLKKTVCSDPELGFMITQSKWNSGFATEAAAGLISYAFRLLGIKRVIASVDIDNIASIKVLDKVGMKMCEETYGKENIYYFEILPNSKD